VRQRKHVAHIWKAEDEASAVVVIGAGNDYARVATAAEVDNG